MSAQVISRSSGRSSVAAAAYRAGVTLTNNRDGRTHDYSRKSGIVHAEIVLPDNAPARWLDRSILWNEVEAAEKQANAQLAREINYSLPRGLARAEQVAYAREYAQYFADQGMVVDFAIHDPDDDDHNPHVHMMLTMRPCDQDGFTAKCKTSYLVRDAVGREVMADADEAKRLKSEGYEKVYTYRKGNERRNLTPVEAAGWDGCVRQGKTPVKEKVMLVPWLDYKDEQQMERWRAKLAEIQNRRLARAGRSDRVDHRSYARRGIEQQAQLHEGPRVTAIEKKARRQAEQQGLKYRPVTSVRRANIAIAEAFARAREALARLSAQIREAATGSERAIGTMLKRTGNGELRGQSRRSASRRVARYVSKLTDPKFRDVTTRRDAMIGGVGERHRDLTAEEEGWLSPGQLAAYRKVRKAEVEGEKKRAEEAAEKAARASRQAKQASSAAQQKKNDPPAQRRSRGR